MIEGFNEQEKYNFTMKLIKRNHLTPVQARYIVEAVENIQTAFGEEVEEKAFMLFMSLAGNVLSENHSREDVISFFNEVISLYSCVDRNLLDWDEVVSLNESYADIKIETKYINRVNKKADEIVKYDGKNWTEQYVKRCDIENSINKSLEYAESLRSDAKEGNSNIVRAKSEGIILGIEYAAKNIREDVLDVNHRKNSQGSGTV